MTTLYEPHVWSSGDAVSQNLLNNIEQGIRRVVPVGMILQGWPDPDPPLGFLTCNGSEVSRAAYPELWAVVDANGWVASGLYGDGDGSATFVLPDIRDRFIKSPASGPGGSLGGSETHDHSIAHNHNVNPPNTSTTSDGNHAHNLLSGVGLASGFDYAEATGQASPQTHNHSVNIGSFTSGGSSTSRSGNGSNLPPFIELYAIVAT